MGTGPAARNARKKPTGKEAEPEAGAVAKKPRNPNLAAPWTSETAPRNGGRPKGAVGMKTIIRRMLTGPVPTHLRVKLAKHIGVSLEAIDAMTMEEVVAAKLAVGFLNDDKLDWMREILDRDAPKSRRVEVEGTVDHHHSVSRLEAGMTEEQAAAAYREMLGGGRVLDVAASPASPEPHPPKPTGSLEAAASDPEKSAQDPERDADK